MKEIKAVIQPSRLSRVREALRKVRIEMITPDEHVDEMVRIIRELCHTGQRGDGVVWVTPVETFSRLRDR
jgi:nitrogen regulatory protein P-II 1